MDDSMSVNGRASNMRHKNFTVPEMGWQCICVRYFLKYVKHYRNAKKYTCEIISLSKIQSTFKSAILSIGDSFK